MVVISRVIHRRIPTMISAAYGDVTTDVVTDGAGNAIEIPHETSGAARFSVNDNGVLVWDNLAEHCADGMVFTK